ncbi:hypothetical protein FJT64_023980 [Amphibalanus amphitrite]|uniref:Uncharacterized protein n=1 Tax=Amphibalanus amphitrite TaxID=1232801 RepID=A0A6A4WPV9_AMPAM|nr:hypothetical protein FJT64_023980 [Amphibalanus amphitrite]
MVITTDANMDLDVADASISSLLRRAGTTASPASGPPSEDRRQRRPDRRRDTLVVRNALLRRAAAGRRRSPAKNDMEQFVRDQELAFDASTSSVDLNMSGSPTTRARSFLAHQRRSLSGDELAALLRDLRSGERRVSVGVPQRQLAALGDDGMQALLGLVDDGLEEFEGTMTASMEEEEETPTPTPSPGPAADEPDRQPSVGDEGSTAGETAADRAEEVARFSAHSRSLFVAAKSPRRLSLAADEEEKQPEKRPFTSGLIDDPDEHSDASGEFQVEPAAAAGGEFPLEPAAAAGGEFQLDPAAAAGGSPQLRSPGSGRISRMSVGSRAAGTPFVPSAESTRLSMRPTGALASSGPSAREASAGETPSAAEAPSRSPAADRSAAPAGSPARSRSLRTSLAGGTTPIQAQPAAAAAGSSSSRPKTKPDPRRPAPGSKLSAKEAFARLFPSFETDQKSRREEAAAKRRHRSSSGPQRKRNSLFGSHGTRRWFKRNAVGLRVTHEALNEVDVAMAKYERMVMRWLREVTGPDRAPTTSDILAVLRRSGTATTEPRLRQLIRMHMPLEQQQELIRVSEYGGRLHPTDNPLEEE